MKKLIIVIIHSLNLFILQIFLRGDIFLFFFFFLFFMHFSITIENIEQKINCAINSDLVYMFLIWIFTHFENNEGQSTNCENKAFFGYLGFPINTQMPKILIL